MTAWLYTHQPAMIWFTLIAWAEMLWGWGGLWS